MSLPFEVLEDIAFWVVTEDTSVEPVKNLIPLLLLDRKTNEFLSFDSNHPLYARIYAAKFDTNATTRRLGKARLTARGLAMELSKRYAHLRLIRTLSIDPKLIEPAIWTAFVMMLENEGKNERLLLERAQITNWLEHYWVTISNSWHKGEDGPPDDLFHAACMWLLCNFYPKGNYDQNTSQALLNAMKPFSMTPQLYPTSHLYWSLYTPREGVDEPPTHEITLYGERTKLTPLPIAIPATISFLGVAETPENTTELSVIGENLGDTEWNRVFGLVGDNLSKVHTIGSLEGVWEGTFMYTDFTAYRAILRDPIPNVVVNTPFTRHRQTSKLREYVTFELPALCLGDTLDAFLPKKPRITETLSGIEIGGVQYLAAADLSEKQKDGKTVQDVIVLGEGHSSWGEFRIFGRVRPHDGLIYLHKDYNNDDRGAWLYMGYLIGDANGIIAGRWRDTYTPSVFAGYEGPFMMTRRK